MVVAGSNKFNSFGCQGAEAYMKFKYFPMLKDAVAYLKGERGCEIVGVEICDDAKPLATAPFKGPTAFLLGNEGDGLTDREMELCDCKRMQEEHKGPVPTGNTRNATKCDRADVGDANTYGLCTFLFFFLVMTSCTCWKGFAYIPHHGQGTASLNVAVAASIVLYQFATWAKYAEAPRSGYKYDVPARPLRQSSKKTLPSASPAEVRQARLAKRARAAANATDSEAAGTLGNAEDGSAAPGSAPASAPATADA